MAKQKVKEAIVEIVAPASFSDPMDLIHAFEHLKKHHLKTRTFIDFEVFHPFHSDEDYARVEDFKRALLKTDSKLMWCLRGGYGSARLIPELLKMKKPKNEKLLIGYSDITSLHTFLNQKWKWKTLHAPTISSFSKKDLDQRSLTETLKIITKKEKVSVYDLIPLNDEAVKCAKVSGVVGGGNLCTLTHTIGTPWSFNGKGKIILLEDVGERGYKIDRMLEHLKNADVFKGAKAVILGDFSDGKEKNGASFVEFSLMRFALGMKIPVYKSSEFGHGNENRPIMFNTSASIIKSPKKFQLKVSNS